MGRPHTFEEVAMAGSVFSEHKAELKQLGDAQVIRLRDVIGLTRLSRSTVLNLIAKEHFPKPFRLGRVLAWRAVDVSRWLDERAAAAEGAK
jgi:predicted DNA-binding transcriptional regulator AlpA